MKKIREQIGYVRPLCFIMGEDNFQNFNLWKNWKKILLYSHLLICPRQHKKKHNTQLKKWISTRVIRDYNLLHQKSSGLVFFSKRVAINISSSQIRKNYALGKSSHGLLPSILDKYIILKKLYHNT